jgi:hypothetical protein
MHKIIGCRQTVEMGIHCDRLHLGEKRPHTDYTYLWTKVDQYVVSCTANTSSYVAAALAKLFLPKIGLKLGTLNRFMTNKNFNFKQIF